MSDLENLLIKCDSLLSLIRYRERHGLSEQTIRELDELLPRLRMATNEISVEKRRVENYQAKIRNLKAKRKKR